MTNYSKCNICTTKLKNLFVNMNLPTAAGKNQTMHFAYNIVGWVEGKQLHILCRPKTLPALNWDMKLNAALTLGSNVYSSDSIQFLTCYPSQPSDPLACTNRSWMYSPISVTMGGCQCVNQRILYLPALPCTCHYFINPSWDQQPLYFKLLLLIMSNT